MSSAFKYFQGLEFLTLNAKLFTDFWSTLWTTSMSICHNSRQRDTRKNSYTG